MCCRVVALFSVFTVVIGGSVVSMTDNSSNTIFTMHVLVVSMTSFTKKKSSTKTPDHIISINFYSTVYSTITVSHMSLDNNYYKNMLLTVFLI